ncbi:ABC transporter ATP-binding protein [Paucibacter sp. R3-3]|uniref:ABC transporter ATP-binding protein n=1 Tax=Roseateles agri TaxID=3098619 RepID=A0ABU5DEJ3_9BURK|nr:ABC transporter ATP-binding protein [Paucibacter sp. R3-3]MDY0744226.1 ABC transporter ATP-binding protein [Paucibacter sp. R3-3]
MTTTMSSPSPIAFEAEALSLSYPKRFVGETRVLQDVSFQLPEGAVIGLVGRNGAGKSSLLRCLLGLALPTSGNSRLLGCPSQALTDDLRERLGYVAQTPDLFGWLNGHEHLHELGRLYRDFDERRALALATRLDLTMSTRADKLSLGDQQKLSVVLALAHDPDLLLMDEPVASLDPLARRDFMRALFAERSPAKADRPRSVLLSSHLLGDLERVVSHVMFLREGRVQLVDEWDALVENLRLLKLDAEPDAALPGLVHCRPAGRGVWHALFDLRHVDGIGADRGQVLRMDDLFEELNA